MILNTGEEWHVFRGRLEDCDKVRDELIKKLMEAK
jgi:hypothetical protein